MNEDCSELSLFWSSCFAFACGWLGGMKDIQPVSYRILFWQSVKVMQ